LPHWYFAYGSNLDTEGMRKRVGSWYDLKKALLRGYKLVFNVYSSSWRGGVANIVEDSQSVVYGAAYLLDEEQLQKLDRYEGVPHLYQRRKVVIELEGKPVEAFVYIGSNPRQALTPSNEYIALMLRGLKKLGYPDEVLKQVRETAERRT